MTPIFIGGTGRSGSTVLKSILSTCTISRSIPQELRFIIDPGGLLDLSDELGPKWTPQRADIGLHNFRCLLKDVSHHSNFSRILGKIASTIGLSQNRYTNYALADYFGPRQFQHSIELFFNDLGASIEPGYWAGTPAYAVPSRIQISRPVSKSKFSDCTRTLMHNLYSGLPGKSGAEQWIDDTPYNILESLRLLELFPDARFIEIQRDPIDVIASQVEQTWGSNKLQTITIQVKDIIERSKSVTNNLPSHTFMRVSLEELVRDSEGQLREIGDFLDINIDAEKVASKTKFTKESANLGAWTRRLSHSEIEVCKKILNQ